MMRQCYILSNNRCFLFRFQNSAFGSKWCGLWFPPNKVIEFFAFNVNGEWLSESNFKGFRLENGIAEHRYNFQDLSVSEQLFMPEHRQGLIDVLQVKNLGAAKDVVVSCKPGINIRELSDNEHSRRYHLTGPTPVVISNELSEIAIGSTADYGFIKEEHYRVHTPGDYIRDWNWRDEVQQSVFEPGIIGTRIHLRKGQKSSTPFIFSSRPDFKYLCNYKRFLPEQMPEQYDNKQLNALARTAMSYYNTSEIGSGFFAGLPWFQHYWARDSAFAIMAATCLGTFDMARSALGTLARFENNGRIPNTIFLNGNALYNSADSNPLFIIALSHYVRHSKDMEFAYDMKPLVRMLLEIAIRKRQDGLIPNRSGESWMDTMDRNGACIELQSFWAEAFLRAAEMYDKNYLNYGKQLLENLNKRFWNSGYFNDRLNDKSRTANVLFPLFFGHIEPEKAYAALAVLESDEFTTHHGIRSLSNRDANYNAKGYHTGNIWGLLTALMCGAEFRYKRIAAGKRYLDIIMKNMGMRCADAVDEVYDGNDGLPLGCVSQVWSIAPVITAIDEFVLGIEPDMHDNIIFDPAGGIDVKRRVRIGNDNFSISCDKNKFIISGLKENNLKTRTTFKVNVV